MQELNNSQSENSIHTEVSESEKLKSAGDPEDKFMRYLLIIVAIFFVGAVIYGSFFSPKSTEQPAENLNGSTISALEGDWFIQPRERKLSLNLATLQARIKVRFIDQTYCNIDILSAGGDITMSRTYKLINDKITFEEPTTGSVIKYTITDINEEENSFNLTDEDGVLQFKLYGYKGVYDIINSENSLKREEFLYPVLTLSERKMGMSQVVEVDGRIKLVEDSDKAEISKIDIYKMF